MRYPTPGETGGSLIRHLIRSLRKMDLPLPLTSHILIATSGGSDSTALAVLLARYGRKIVPEPHSQITLLHVNHGWREAESDRDEDFVRNLAATLGVGFMSHRLEKLPAAGESWEEHARRKRKAIYRAEAEETDALVFTAHTADDVAETLLWRIFTGAYERESAGILERHGPEVRPLLEVRKEVLRQFLREEKCEWREDSTNAGGRFLRARMRQELIPSIESFFPRAIESLLAMRKIPERVKKLSARKPPVKAKKTAKNAPLARR